MGNDSGVEIKVINPRRGDNVVHPVGAGRAASLPVADDDRRRQQGNGERPQRRRQQVRGMILEHSKQYRPWMVPGFVVVNIVVFTITMYVNDCPKNTDSCVAKFLGRLSFQPLKENPLLGPSSSTLVNLGALDVSKVVQRQQGWRLITCIWLHAGVFHILANMLSLVFIGIRLEREFGFLKIGFVYLVSGFGGSLMSSLFIQTNISVGASGALFGLLGSMLSELLTNWTIYENKFAALLTLIFIVLLNLAMGILPHVDNFAHIGGFLSGFLLGFVFLVRPQYGYVNEKHIPPGFITASPKPKYKTYQYILWIISLILLIVGFIVGTVLLLRGINLNDRCSWCHYLSCVPTKFWSCKQNVATCETSQLGNQLNITCTSNGKSDIYTLSNESSSRISELCTELCS